VNSKWSKRVRLAIIWMSRSQKYLKMICRVLIGIRAIPPYTIRYLVFIPFFIGAPPLFPFVFVALYSFPLAPPLVLLPSAPPLILLPSGYPLSSRCPLVTPHPSCCPLVTPSRLVALLLLFPHCCPLYPYCRPPLFYPFYSSCLHS
jgi:hypothetical protein